MSIIRIASQDVEERRAARAIAAAIAEEHLEAERDAAERFSSMRYEMTRVGRVCMES